MKKPLLGLTVCFFLFTTLVFGQTIDRSLYRAIDPFDYKLDEDRAARGAVRRFKSVLRFVSNSGNLFLFSSLDGNTSMDFTVNAPIPPPTPGQVVTVYFTATQRVIDTRILDEIDYTNTTESGIGLVKSTIPASSGIRRSDYVEIEPFDYRSEALFYEEGSVRRYRSVVHFSSKDGIIYYFSCPENSTMLHMKVNRRFPPLAAGQRVTVFYTASKEFLDYLLLDDIEF